MSFPSASAFTNGNPNTVTTSSRLDESIMNTGTPTGLNGVSILLNSVQKGTTEVKNLLHNECDVILECKICRNLFRSIPNFVAHKRSYCRASAAELVRQQFLTMNDNTNAVQPPATPSSQYEQGASNLLERPSSTESCPNLPLSTNGASETSSPTSSRTSVTSRGGIHSESRSNGPATKITFNFLNRLTKRMDACVAEAARNPGNTEPPLISMHALPTITKVAPFTTFENGVQVIKNPGILDKLPSKERNGNDDQGNNDDDTLTMVVPQDAAHRLHTMELRTRRHPDASIAVKEISKREQELYERMASKCSQRCDLTALQCLDCKKCFKSLDTLAFHLSCYHYDPLLLLEESATLTCLLCGSEYSNIRSHANSEHKAIAAKHDEEANVRKKGTGNPNGTSDQAASADSEVAAISTNEPASENKSAATISSEKAASTSGGSRDKVKKKPAPVQKTNLTRDSKIICGSSTKSQEKSAKDVSQGSDKAVKKAAATTGRKRNDSSDVDLILFPVDGDCDDSDSATGKKPQPVQKTNPTGNSKIAGGSSTKIQEEGATDVSQGSDKGVKKAVSTTGRKRNDSSDAPLLMMFEVDEESAAGNLAIEQRNTEAKAKESSLEKKIQIGQKDSVKEKASPAQMREETESDAGGSKPNSDSSKRRNSFLEQVEQLLLRPRQQPTDELKQSKLAKKPILTDRKSPTTDGGGSNEEALGAPDGQDGSTGQHDHPGDNALDASANEKEGSPENDDHGKSTRPPSSSSNYGASGSRTMRKRTLKSPYSTAEYVNSWPVRRRWCGKGQRTAPTIGNRTPPKIGNRTSPATGRKTPPPTGSRECRKTPPPSGRKTPPLAGSRDKSDKQKVDTTGKSNLPATSSSAKAPKTVKSGNGTPVPSRGGTRDIVYPVLFTPEQRSDLNNIVCKKTFSCLKCQSTFSNLPNCERHCYTHFGFVRFKCKYCEVATFYRTDLRRHLQKDCPKLREKVTTVADMNELIVPVCPETPGAVGIWKKPKEQAKEKRAKDEEQEEPVAVKSSEKRPLAKAAPKDGSSGGKKKPRETANVESDSDGELKSIEIDDEDTSKPVKKAKLDESTDERLIEGNDETDVRVHFNACVERLVQSMHSLVRNAQTKRCNPSQGQPSTSTASDSDNAGGPKEN